MSKRPGLGARYLATHGQWHRSGLRNFTQVNGQISRLPRYYKDKFFDEHQKALLRVESERHSLDSYWKEVDRLRQFHEDPTYYFDERERTAHERIFSKINDNSKF